MSAEPRTIHADDWREMFRRARAQGAAEGNQVLQQIRAAVARLPINQRAAQGFVISPGVEQAPPAANSVSNPNQQQSKQ